MTRLLWGLLLVGAVSAHAQTFQTVTLTWDPVTMNIDGSPLSASAIQGYRVYVGPSPDALTLQTETADTTVTLTDVPMTPPPMVTVTTVRTDGLESPVSQGVTLRVDAPAAGIIRACEGTYTLASGQQIQIICEGIQP